MRFAEIKKKVVGVISMQNIKYSTYLEIVLKIKI